jgi:hypothetical protein
MRSRGNRDEQQRQNLLMFTNQEWTDEASNAMAIAWRRKALEGGLHARGMVHEFETEFRRHAGAPHVNDPLRNTPMRAPAARIQSTT